VHPIPPDQDALNPSSTLLRHWHFTAFQVRMAGMRLSELSDSCAWAY
jgi:hypothetical protein